MPRTIKSQAIVIKRTEVLQKDVIITLLTQEFGKLRVMAKGIKQITSRRSPHLQSGNLINVVISQSERGSYLQQTDLVSGFTAIKASPEKMEYFYTFFFIIDRIIPEEQLEDKIFALVKSFLVELSRTEMNASLLQKYLYYTLHQLGYANEEKPLDELIRLTEEIINEKVPTDVII